MKHKASCKCKISYIRFIIYPVHYIAYFFIGSSTDILLYEDIYTLKSILSLAYLLTDSVNKLIKPYKAINVDTLKAIDISNYPVFSSCYASYSYMPERQPSPLYFTD